MKQGLRENWKQFSLLVLINAFVGGMVGLERSILPELAEVEFEIAARSAILSFILVFGIVKAITNYFTGMLADRVGRKNLLIIGWLFAIPVPLILMYAPSWDYVVLANVLLGINQGLTWSTTVVMKIDLVGTKNRGLAMGINESAGYLAVGAVAFLTAWIAAEYAIRPYPFYLGLGMSLAGLFGSLFLVRDTAGFVHKEIAATAEEATGKVFWKTTWKDNNLGSITQAGLVNNLNDAMVWGILPILLSIRGFDLVDIGKLVAIYPAIWGIGQLGAGRLADLFPKKRLLFWGILLQGLALFLFLYATTFFHFALISVFLGLGTAIVYPTFLAGIADFAHPKQRVKSIGIFRLWRDLGYAVGALLTSIVADNWGVMPSIGIVAGLTVLSAMIILIRME